MIYIRMKYLSCVFLMTLLSLAYASPSDSSLRLKLQRLLRDPEYDDGENEIKPRQIQGMLLKDLREHNLFDSSSEERFYMNLNKVEKTSERSILSKEENLSISTTTSTSIPPTVAAAPTTSGQRTRPIIVGIERLSSMISRLIDMWRNP
ncbi:uncharacterized protein LOC124418557 [Lucilia cuprina]|uniref:uncharacterized protein LOC124418557 n=1 Tax=Lucilia cuprina TaxID=7375 RepID=UPI001F058632|nr:uncharacterized protein LOC124418557 [Lucilia cuprina]